MIGNLKKKLKPLCYETAISKDLLLNIRFSFNHPEAQICIHTSLYNYFELLHTYVGFSRCFSILPAFDYQPMCFLCAYHWYNHCLDINETQTHRSF